MLGHVMAAPLADCVVFLQLLELECAHLLAFLADLISAWLCPGSFVTLLLQLLPACLSVLPRLVRLLAAADAAAAGAGVSHAATPAAAAAAAGSPAYRALLGLAGEAGDSRYLQQVPLLLALLMDGR